MRVGTDDGYCCQLERIHSHLEEEPLSMPVRDSLDVLADVGRISIRLHCRQSHSLGREPWTGYSGKIELYANIHSSLFLDCEWKVNSGFGLLPP